MKRAVVPSGWLVNAAYHSRVNPELRRYRNSVITQRRTGPCSLLQYKNVRCFGFYTYTLLYSLFK